VVAGKVVGEDAESEYWAFEISEEVESINVWIYDNTGGSWIRAVWVLMT
jgi:hypothetical protein